jgi:hypothetical protein
LPAICDEAGAFGSPGLGPRPGDAWAAGCGKSAPTKPAVPLEASQFDGERALYEVHRLVALGARDAGTPGAERAAQHLKKRLQELGVEARLDTFTNQTPLGARAFHNVIGRIPGTRSGLILLGSHFDTKSGIAPDFQGANDSGSSTGVLLELARLLAKHGSPGPEIHLLFFDGEEAVQHYSEWTACTAAGITPSAWWRRGGTRTCWP